MASKRGIRADKRIRSTAGRSQRTGRFAPAASLRGSFSDEISQNLGKLGPKIRARVNERLEDLGRDMVTWAQANATWTDRTGVARAGLSYEVLEEGTPTVVFFHTASYGVWLEIRWSGKYAIIVPTIEKFGPEMMTRLEGLI